MKIRGLSVFAIALLVGLGCALPNILGKLELKSEYEPFTDSYFSDTLFDETAFYAPAVSFFKEMGSFPGEMEVYEYKDRPNLMYPLPIIIEGGIAYFLKDLKSAWFFIHFFFPMLSFLLVYLLARRLTPYRLVAVLSSLVFCTLGFGARTFFNLLGQARNCPLFFSRISSPAVTLPFLLLTLIGLVNINKRRFKSGILLAGIFGGSLFYTYYFYQLSFALCLVLLVAVYLFNDQRQKVWSLITSGIIANLLAIPWYLKYLQTKKYSNDFIQHWSFSQTKPELGLAAFFIFLALFFIFSRNLSFREKFMNRVINSGYLPLGVFIMSAVFLRFGLLPFLIPLIQPAHFLQQLVYGFLFLAVSCLIFNRLIFFRKANKFSAYAGIVLLLLMLFLKQADFWVNTKKYCLADPLQRRAEQLVGKFTGKNDVIGIQDFYLNSAFAARVWRFKFYAGFFLLSSMHKDENLQRYLFIQKVFNRSKEQIMEQISRKKVRVPLKTVTINHIFGLGRGVNEQGLRRLLTFYESLNNEYLKGKKLDYLLCLGEAQEKDMLAGAEKLKMEVNLVARDQNVSLYKVGAFKWTR